MTPRPSRIAFTYRGRRMFASAGQSVAAALLENGVLSWRQTRRNDTPRGAFCGIGICFDCLLTLDGQTSQRACLTSLRDGMTLGDNEVGSVGGVQPAAAPAAVVDDSRDRQGAVEVAVVGAGPAGLAAAVTAADCGLQVALVDAAQRPGGQFWRHPDPALNAVESAGHHGWSTFTGLRDRLRAHVAAGRIRYLSGTSVALIEPGEPFRLHLAPVSVGDEPVVPVLLARELILCPGGYDRQLPVPGWDMPGVFTAGGLQSLLKGSRTLPGRRVVLAGTGPFLLPVATGVAAAGGQVVVVAEANSAVRWLRQALLAVRVPSKAVEGLGYAAALARHRIAYRTRTVVIRVVGQDRVRGAVLARLDAEGRVVPGTEREVKADVVAFGWGFSPSLDLLLALGAASRVDVDGSLVVDVDDQQRTSVPRVRAAGEATGVGGAELAQMEGELAAKSLAGQQNLEQLRAKIARARGFARAMHQAHPIPARWADWLSHETLACRCEEVTVGQIRYAVAELGATDPRTVRALSRAGMGWCQGRVCAHACALLVSGLTETPLSATDLEAVGRRTLAAPLSLSRLAELDQT